MQEHLIPQDISNYKFHLIGELDLKQFGEIMAGILGGVGIYFLTLPLVVKWTLIVCSVGIGLFAAFIPLGGMPLSHWLSVYFKLLFAPTKFYWRKETAIPSYFTYELPARNREFLESNSTFNDTPARKHRAIAYFSTLGQADRDTDDPLEKFTDANVAKATEDFNYDTAPVAENVVAPKVLIKPQVVNDQSVRQRQIVTPSQESLDSFLETNSIFQPVQITDQITAVDAKMASADSTLAAALSDNSPDSVTTSGQPVVNAPFYPVSATPPPSGNFESITAPAAPTTPITGITAPNSGEIILPDLNADTTPIPPPTINVEPVSTAGSFDSGVILPDLSTPTTPAAYRAAQTTPLTPAPPNPPLIMSQ